ncbi:hypothetical protein [Variovorax ginsengisoli]|uniref:Uncharacterized protein n=1 Tax=Variovorax ginsengisoli TaxID=363844 RepID=A0ABT9SC33_9BURK|nr:hypothetical protein [Variovorax ginsengisoli]MDP9901336.1 hypothetical protein [Variovorax ginsengisoli]
MSPSHDTIDVWAVEGQFEHLIYSPKGSVEGVLIDTDGVPTQFVFAPHDDAAVAAFSGLRAGQALVIEGSEQGPSPKGEPAHTVYDLQRLVSVDGHPPWPAQVSGAIEGTVARLNYARHGEPNGVVLDTGDFVHTKPDGLARLGLKVGDKVKAEGRTQPLSTGGGRVVEATQVNGKPVKAPAAD